MDMEVDERESSDGGDGDDDSFGQSVPPLHVYVKRVLDKYPEGGQILKELLQNADDAGARKVIFLYDKKSHPTEHLWSPELESLNGPALCVYNDAAFRSEDWKNIQHPEQSGKHDDPTKVGRFGLGFISVYHLTDLPSIFSDNCVGFLDPNEKYFATDPSTNVREKGKRGKRWRISQKLLQPPLKDQFTPYLEPLFDCTADTFKRGQYEGTIFRFPLRRDGTDSKISGSTYNEERVQSLIRSFQNDAEISLLFLKNVESVSIYERDSKERNPKLVYRLEMTSEDKVSLKNERSRFLSECKGQQTTTVMSRIQAKISTQTREQNPEQACVNHYTVINCLKRHGLGASMQALVENKDLKQLPWVGIAAKRVSDVQSNESMGRLFCFLPLPESESSPLPVHIHGYFGLGDNRRSIKWPDKESEHDIAAQWNVGLVEEVFPEAYVDLIQTSISCGLPPSTVYGFWPRIADLRGAWGSGVKLAINMLKIKETLYTELGGGQWKKPSEVYIDTQNSSLVQKVLLQKGYPVVQLPKHVLEALRWGNVEFKEVTPQLMREVIKGDLLDWLERQEKMELLKYILTDHWLQSMENIYLLPLSNGSFIQFSSRGETIYIPNSKVPKQLFPNMEHSLVSDDFPDILKSPEAQMSTQLKMLSVDVVPSLLKECLQRVWPNGSQTVKWIPGDTDQPGKDWLQELWKWLQKEEITLHSFVSLPLIQIGMEDEAIILARIDPNCMIFKTYQSFATPTELSETVCSFLESIQGIVVRNTLPDFIGKHTQIKQVIASGNGEGVMKMLEYRWSTSMTSIQQNVAVSPAILKKDLLNLLSQIQRLPNQWKQIVNKLPLFQTNTGEFVSVQQCEVGVKDGFLGIPVQKVNHQFILINNESSSLAKELGVREVTLENLLERYILPCIGTRYYSEEERDTLMKWLLDRAHLDTLVVKTKFIPTSTGELASPRELFDPDNTLLRFLYHNKPVFPTQQYASGRLLGHIRRVGFKQELSISAEEIFQIAVETSQTKDSTRSKALLDFLCKHPNQLSSITLFEKTYHSLGSLLNKIAWVNCEVSPPYLYNQCLPWCPISKSLQCPNNVQLESHANLVGSVMPLVKVSKLHPQFGTFFSWSTDTSNIRVEHVVRHLKKVATTYDKGIVSNDHSVFSLMNDIYAFLQKIPIEKLTPLFIEENMDNVPWVWHGKGFANAQMVAFSSGISSRHLPAHLHLVPSGLRNFKAMFIKLGVKESFTADDYLSILHSLKRSTEQKRLSSEQMDTVQDVLKAVVSFSDDLQEFHEQLLVPDCNCVLRPCDEVIYNDLDWNQTSEEFIYAHKCLTRHQAKRLGIKTQRDVQLDRCSSDLGFEQPFGQTEKLTTRLRGILREYSHTPDVLKELLQNADDAGASELHIVFDRRKHKGSRISGPEWKPMHESPALCVYNNKPFTDEDILGIQNVGVGGKISDATTTGRFGIGFNAVYHLTDCPTFLTQNARKLCIFDPHVKYVPRATPSKPGKLYKKDRDNNYEASFPDMNEGYLGEYNEFDLQRGTMFRFPLRQNDSKLKSEISDETYSTERVYALLEEFEKVSADSLLFLNNVHKISISEINPTSGQLELRYSVKASLSDEDEKQRQKITDDLKEFKFSQTKNASQINCVYGMKVTDTRKRDEEWLVCQTLRYSDPNGYMVRMAEFMDKAFIPRGGVAAQMSGAAHKGTKGQAFCFLPLQINTSLPVCVNGTFKLDQSRRNLKKGNSEIIHPWNKLLAEQVIAPAYACLIEAAGKWLFKSKSRVSNRDGLWVCDAFDRLFPTELNQLSDVWKLIAVSTLKYIGDSNMKVLPVVRSNRKAFKFDDVEWFSPTYSVDNAFFDNLNALDENPDHLPSPGREKRSEEKKSNIFRQFLLDTGFNLISSHPAICRAFKAKAVGVEAAFVSPQFCIQHIRTAYTVTRNLPCHIGESAFKTIVCLGIVLEYCLNGIDDVKDLYGLPLQLDGSNILMTFSNSNAKYLTYNYGLIPRRPDIFVHRDICYTLFQWLSKNRMTEKTHKEGLLKEFTIEDLAQFIHTQLPAIWKGSRTFVEWNQASSDQPNIVWLQMLWKFIGDRSIEPLEDWPIFPTKCGRLFAPIIGKHVLFLDTYTDTIDRRNLSTTLQNLGCPVVDVEKMARPRQSTPIVSSLFFHPSQPLPNLTALNKYLATPFNHRDVLNVLLAMISNVGSSGWPLKAFEYDEVLRYFQVGVKNLLNAELNQLKSLPLFPCAYSSQRISIHQFRYCYTNEDKLNIPDRDFNESMREQGCVFLKFNIVLAELYKHLKIEQVGTIDIYKRHILPLLNQLPHPKQLIHVKFIRDILLPVAFKDDRDELHRALKDVEFIPSIDGQHHKASYYFDSDNHVFSKMVEPHRLLPEEFCKPEWQLFLINIGLQNTVTGRHFINFAKDIESRSKMTDCYDNLKAKSRVLLTEFRHNTSLHETEVLSTIATIRFIPFVLIDKVRQEMFPQYTATQFICYKGGVPEQHKQLVWSVDSLIPSYALPNQSVQKSLGIQLEPSLQNVVKHTQNVCNNMVQHNAHDKEDSVGPLRSELSDILKKIMTFLNNDNIQSEVEIISQLRDTPICLVEDQTVLVKANQLVFEMTKTAEDQFRPYLYKAPRDLAQFDTLLKILGTKEEMTFDQIASVLNGIRGNCKDLKMDINERKKAHHATNCLYKLLISTKGKCDITIKSLYLPTSEDKLQLSSQLYYTDLDESDAKEIPSATDIQLIIPLKQILGQGSMKEAELFMLLPVGLRPKKIATKEKPLVSNSVCCTKESSNCPLMAQTLSIIKSSDTSAILLRLLQHQLEGIPDSEQQNNVAKLQDFDQLKCVQELRTGYFDDNGICLGERKKSRYVFLEEKGNGECELSFAHNEISDPTTQSSVFFLPLADSICRICKLNLDKLHIQYLNHVLPLPSMALKNTFLADCEVPEYDNLGEDFPTQRERPGSHVPRDIWCLLDDDMRNKFHPNETAVYRPNGDDEVYIYVEIIERLPMENIHPDSTSFCRQYKIDIGEDSPIVVSVTDLYKFRRNLEAGETLTSEQGATSTNEVTQYTGSQRPGTHASQRKHKGLEEVKTHIRQDIEEAMKLPGNEKKKCLRRLYRKWHPDKNPEQVELATKAFQFLQQEIERVTNQSTSTFDFSQWDADISRECSEEQQYRERARQHQSHTTNRQQSGSGSFPRSFTNWRPDPRKAKLWFRQAEEDLKTAEEYSRKREEGSKAWTALMIQQAIEKALKAVIFQADGSQSMSHNLFMLISSACDHQSFNNYENRLRVLVNQLVALGCDAIKPRYPEDGSYRTTGEKYDNFDSEQALTLCRSVFDIVKEMLNIS